MSIEFDHIVTYVRKDAEKQALIKQATKIINQSRKKVNGRYIITTKKLELSMPVSEISSNSPTTLFLLTPPTLSLWLTEEKPIFKCNIVTCSKSTYSAPYEHAYYTYILLHCVVKHASRTYMENWDKTTLEHFFSDGFETLVQKIIQKGITNSRVDSNAYSMSELFGMDTNSGIKIDRSIYKLASAADSSIALNSINIASILEQHALEKEKEKTAFGIFQKHTIVLFVALQCGTWWIFNPWPCNDTGANKGAPSSTGKGACLLHFDDAIDFSHYLSMFTNLTPESTSVLHIIL